MLLGSLELENVRSYRRARIAFPKGRSLLSGDIGAGKSTVLLAIEFALFGLIRGWNDGEKLLRHGAVHARVRLEADIEGPIVIERSLKRTSSGIQQEDVTLIEGGIERTITPSEARAFIVARLGYPSEFVTKQPVLFRYTIFTAQESMKQIIEERPEARLAAIRTIFGIDRYESITKNALIVARSLKQTSASLAGRLERTGPVIEGIAQIAQQLRATRDEHERAVRVLGERDEALTHAAEALEAARVKLDAEREKRAEHERRLAERAQLESELESLIGERADLSLVPIGELPDLEALEERIGRVEAAIGSFDDLIEQRRDERSRALTRAASVRTERDAVLETIDELGASESERIRFERALAPVRERFARFDPQAVRTELERIDANANDARDARARLDERIRSERERIATMPSDVCPTCKQKVDSEHREDAIRSITRSIDEALAEHERIEERLGTLSATRDALSVRLAEYEALEERIRSAPKDRSAELVSKRASSEELERTLATLASTIASADERIESLLEERTSKVSEREGLRKKLKHAQTLHLQAERSRRAIERAEAIDLRMNLIRNRMSELSSNEPILDPNVPVRFEKARDAHVQLQSERLDAARAVERLDERMRSFTERSRTLEEELEALRALEKRRGALTDVIGFLSDALPDLSARIESAIMRRILIETNDHYSKWFGLLVDDLESYLDERFTPRIVQSGYDVSFENLSGGERTSVALAFRLALHESITHLTGRSSTGLLILDEPTDGFSSEQLDSVRTVLTQLRSEQVIIVSHEPAVESFVDQVIRIEKRGDESVPLSG